MSHTILTIKIKVNENVRYIRQRIPMDNNIPTCLTGSGADATYNCFSKGYGLYKKGKFFSDVIRGVYAAQKGLPIPSTIGPALGAPGVFSISPFPVVDKEGKLGFTVSGILFEHIVAIYIGSMKIFGNRNFYLSNSPIAM